MSDLSAAVVLAAGQGTRMRSATPKALHEVAGRSLVGHVLAAVQPLRPEHTVVVIGHGRDLVADHLGRIAPGAELVVQEPQGGTGEAARLALAALPRLTGDVLVVPGDSPLLTTATLERLLAAHRDAGAEATLLTAVLPDPTGYGRVLRGPDGGVAAVVEETDADEDTRAIREVAVSVYVFAAATLADALSGLDRDNAQGEEYLTDVVAMLTASGRRVVALAAADWEETLGVNDRSQLAGVGRRIRDRILAEWMRAGVTVVDPETTWVDAEVSLAADVTLLPNSQLCGQTSVASGAVVGPGCTLTDTVVAAGAHVTYSVCREAQIGPDAVVGPFTYLRPGTRLGRGAKAGAFVEMKSADLGDEAKVPHLSYVGDATIGQRSNIGAATVFVNYDGQDKHRTKVGDDVRVGSDSMLVAPVEIGDGAYTAAGSVITQDVPPGALGVGRARQRNVEGWVERRRPGTRSAAAARRSGAAAGTEDTGGDDTHQTDTGPGEQ